MNDWNQWEHQLSGWVPRRPALKLKRRLFGATPTAGRESGWPLSWNRLIATAAFLLLAVVVWMEVYQVPINSSASRASSLLASLSLSNQNLASYYSPHRHSHENAWSVVRSSVGTFEWTNAPRSASITGSFLLLKTNSLIH